jgi:hypothetical protein
MYVLGTDQSRRTHRARFWCGKPLGAIRGSASRSSLRRGQVLASFLLFNEIARALGACARCSTIYEQHVP